MELSERHVPALDLACNNLPYFGFPFNVNREKWSNAQTIVGLHLKAHWNFCRSWCHMHNHLGILYKVGVLKYSIKDTFFIYHHHAWLIYFVNAFWRSLFFIGILCSFRSYCIIILVFIFFSLTSAIIVIWKIILMSCFW